MNATATENKIDLKRYCSDEDGRFTFSNPFVRAEMRYATDGRVAVRVPAPGEANTETEGVRLPTPELLNWPDAAESDLRSWPAAAYTFTKERDDVECDECGEECGVYGWEPKPERQDIGGHDIGTGYHYLISLLPNVRYLPYPDDANPEGPMYFRFDGGEGLLMFMRKLEGGK